MIRLDGIAMRNLPGSALAIACLALGLSSPLQNQNQAGFDKTEVTAIEDLSESLANALLDFSVAVRDRDFERISSFFADEVKTATFPVPSSSKDERVKWVSLRSTGGPGDLTIPTTREKFMDDLKTLLEHFSQIEDARFKVTDAEFAREQAGIRGRTKIKFFMVGRDHNERPLWIKGSGHLEAHETGTDAWKISSLAFQRIETLKSAVDLFSEVSLPAGVSVSVPPYGSPGNDSFVYHGAAAGDIDQDGFVDLVVSGLDRNYIYLNQGGSFEERSRELGIPAAPRATAPLLVDYDNDGDLDLFLAAVGDQMLFQNRLKPDGALNFIDVSQESGAALPAIGFSAAAADVNGDGWPDIYVTSYNRYGVVMPNSWHQATNGTPNLLFLNQKNGTFKEAGEEWGVRDRRWGYAAQFADVNGDGRQDLYVANDFGENALYINQGGSFQDRAAEWGVLDPGNGMGVSFGDYNNDGRLDLHVTNMSSTAGKRILDRLFPEAGGADNVLKKLAGGNSLFQGRPDGRFTNVTQEVGPFAAGWAWGGVFIDFDNDGWQDLYSPNGFISGKSMKDT